MPKTSSRKSTAESISKQTLMTTVSNLSKQYRLLPCFCEQDPLRMMKQKSTSSVQKMSSFTTEQQNSNATNQTTKKKKKRKNVRRQQQRKKLVLQNQNAHVINVVLFPTRISFILCQKCKIRKIIHSCFFSSLLLLSNW